MANLTRNDFRFLNERYEENIYQTIYQTSDNRTWKSNIRDIYNGDNFSDFCKDYFKLLDEEGYWD